MTKLRGLLLPARLHDHNCAWLQRDCNVRFCSVYLIDCALGFGTFPLFVYVCLGSQPGILQVVPFSFHMLQPLNHALSILIHLLQSVQFKIPLTIDNGGTVNFPLFGKDAASQFGQFATHLSIGRTLCDQYCFTIKASAAPRLSAW